jgi:hypothetical protein
MKNTSIHIDKGKLYKIESGAHRQALIDLGMYSIPTHKVHKNKKAYTRKTKHKNK